MYEYVFSSGVCQPFRILKMPRDELDPNGTEDILGLISSVLTVETDDTAPDPESYLSDLSVQEVRVSYLESGN